MKKQGKQVELGTPPNGLKQWYAVRPNFEPIEGDRFVMARSWFDAREILTRRLGLEIEVRRGAP